MLIIKGGNIHDAKNATAYCADILIENGKIFAIGAADGMLSKEAQCTADIFDATGLDVYPGFIDAHSHIGMFGAAGAGTKDDVESTSPAVPEQRGLDAINPLEPTFQQAREAGVTTVCVGPGSVSVIAGTHAAIKTVGHHIDRMVVKDPVAMKAAVGENPKKHLQAVTTRMTEYAIIRDSLLRAKEYGAKKERAAGHADKMPAYDPKSEALLPVIRREIPLKVHAYRIDDLQALLRVARECNIRLTLEHASDSYLIADLLREQNVPVAVGPFFLQNRRQENEHKHPKYAVELIRAGVNVSVMTDSPAIAVEYLPLSAGLLMREGLDEFEALKTITVNAARHLGIEDRVGTIEVGKDADLVIAKGCPMAMTVKPRAVLIDGSIVYRCD